MKTIGVKAGFRARVARDCPYCGRSLQPGIHECPTGEAVHIGPMRTGEPVSTVERARRALERRGES